VRVSSRESEEDPVTLSVEGVLEHGKLWCLVNHMWKMLWPQGGEMDILSFFSVVKKASVAMLIRFE